MENSTLDRTPTLRKSRYAFGIAALIGTALLVGILSRSDSNPQPSHSEGLSNKTGEIDADPALANQALKPLTPTEIIGARIHDLDAQPETYERCDSKARSDMQMLIVQVSDSEVVVRETAWTRKSLSTRVGLASWLSECTQNKRALSIRGDESGSLLATYGPKIGFEAAEPDRSFPN